MLTLGIVLFVVGLLLCASIAWAPLGFIAMGLGLICGQIGARRTKTARSREEDATREPPRAAKPAIDRNVSPTRDLIVSSSQSADELRWKSIIDGDPELARIERTLAPYGRSYVDQFAKIYVLFNNKAMLPAILNLIIESARQAAVQDPHLVGAGAAKDPDDDGAGVDQPQRHKSDFVPPATAKPMSGARPRNALQPIASSAQPDQADTATPVVRSASEQDEWLTQSSAETDESDNLYSIFEQLNVR